MVTTIMLMNCSWEAIKIGCGFVLTISLDHDMEHHLFMNGRGVETDHAWNIFKDCI